MASVVPAQRTRAYAAEILHPRSALATALLLAYAAQLCISVLSQPILGRCLYLAAALLSGWALARFAPPPPTTTPAAPAQLTVQALVRDRAAGIMIGIGLLSALLSFLLAGEPTQ